jgi:hypothetical protein
MIKIRRPSLTDRSRGFLAFRRRKARLVASLHNAGVGRPVRRASAGVPVPDPQGDVMVFFRIKVTERTGRFEKC